MIEKKKKRENFSFFAHNGDFSSSSSFLCILQLMQKW